MKTFLKVLGTSVLALGLASVSAFSQTSQDPQQQPAQSPSAQEPTQAPSAQQPSQSPSTMDQGQQVQTFMGTVVKENGGYWLKDDAAKTSYKVDNEDQIKKFKNKNVKVTGTLDPATNSIHVTNVEMATAN
jgi:biotin carboxyl carrier protein